MNMSITQKGKFRFTKDTIVNLPLRAVNIVAETFKSNGFVPLAIATRNIQVIHPLNHTGYAQVIIPGGSIMTIKNIHISRNKDNIEIVFYHSDNKGNPMAGCEWRFKSSAFEETLFTNIERV